MSRVLIVARTRMRNSRVCVGGHDLDADFRSVRLLRSDGSNMFETSPLAVGDIWAMEYRDSPGLHAPHLEDVLVAKGAHVNEVERLERFLRKNTSPWRGNPRLLFDGTVAATPSGTAYVPNEGPLPERSTGYWIPGHDLDLRSFDEKDRFVYLGGGDIERFSWVGMEDPPESIAAGSLVRVSLARLYSPSSAQAGYYVQISGIYRD
jgi:hypothetical protein